MDNNILKVESMPLDEPIVIPDECGDSMWDKVLEQSAFAEAVKLSSKGASGDVKVNEVKK